MSEHEGTSAYEDGYMDACAITDTFVSTLMEDVEKYQQAYLRIAKRYQEHMATCAAAPARTGDRGGSAG